MVPDYSDQQIVNSGRYEVRDQTHMAAKTRYTVKDRW